MARVSTYTDEELAAAVRGAVSWRGVLRDLGLRATSGAEIVSVRRHADRLGLSIGHLSRDNASVSDDELVAAVESCQTWGAVAKKLGCRNGSAISTLKRRSGRLGLDISHLSRHDVIEPNVANLRRAGSLLAAAWFSLCGYNVSWPLEPCRFDLLASRGPVARKIQVKTTTVKIRDTWKVYLSSSGRERRTYSGEEIDEFFVIDGDMIFYLIPVDAVLGMQAIHLSGYAQYRVKQLSHDPNGQPDRE